MSLADKHKQIVEQFAGLSGWEARYKKIISLGQKLQALPDAEKSDELTVQGCQSQVWIKAHLEGGRVHFQADSDAMIVKGLVALLLRFYSGEAPKDILQTPPKFIEELGLQGHLSPSRANGLMAMVKQLKYYAMAYQTLLEKSDPSGGWG